MYYTRITVHCSEELAQILIAEMCEAGFDTFQETDEGFEAYAEQEQYNTSALEDIKRRYQEHDVQYDADRIEKKNWNEEWEKNYQPIIVEDTCIIRAEFHQPEKQYPFDIIITPKMSFGTGHHETTYLMIKTQLKIDHHNKEIVDAGCGTAILSIMASTLGARHIEAFDIDEWSVINGEENVQMNRCPNIRIRQGKIGDLTFEKKADIILANINRNILLDEMPSYVHLLNPDGKLLLSGFYESDIASLLKKANELGLSEISRDTKNSWASLLLKMN